MKQLFAIYFTFVVIKVNSQKLNYKHKGCGKCNFKISKLSALSSFLTSG